jgi:ankyrin repeat protein
MKIGISAKINKEFVTLFPQSQELQDYMAEYLILMVNFCMSIVTFTRRSLMSQMASSFVLSFEKAFSNFEKDLGYWANAINEKTRLLTAKSQLESQSAIGKLLTTAELHRYIHKERCIQLLSRLSPQQEEFDCAWRRQRRKGSVSWILREARYIAWKNSTSSSFLWLSGSLGTGKSVAMANIAGNLYDCSEAPSNDDLQRSLSRPIIATCFCQYQNKRTLESGAVIGSIIRQFLEGSDATMAEQDLSLWDGAPSDPNKMASLAVKLLPRERKYFVILDGLDDCAQRDLEDIFSSLKLLFDSLVLCICCSGHTDSLVKQLSAVHVPIAYHISMSNPKRQEEIRGFIDGEMERRHGIRSLSAELQEFVRKTLYAGAQGMYLWVVLQLESVFPEYQASIMSDAEVVRIISTLPADLNEVFHRALARIPNGQYGKTIFEIVTAASRALTTEELKVALNVEPGNKEWNSLTLAKRGEMVVHRYGGSLLEVDEETKTVHFIHHSVLQYLTDPNSDSSCVTNRFNVSIHDAEVVLGGICATYLSYAVHERRVTISNQLILDKDKTAERICRSVLGENERSEKILEIMFSRRSSSQYQFDVAAALRNYASSRVRLDEVLALLEYAGDNWLNHTKFLPLEHPAYPLFLDLATGEAPHMNLPWPYPSTKHIASWAVEFGHPALFRGLVPALSKSMELVDENMVSFVRQTDVRYLQGVDWSRFLRMAVSQSPQSLLLIDKLLSLGANPNSSHPLVNREDIHALQAALLAMKTRPRDLQVIKSLLAYGAHPDGSGRSDRPLIIATRFAWTECIKLLLESGASLGKVPEGNATALGLAIEQGQTDLVKLLLQKGADLNEPYISTGWDRTNPLSTAIRSDNKEIVSLLLRYGADPNLYSKTLVDPQASEPIAPLILALQLSKPDIADVLLRAGAVATEWFPAPSPDYFPLLLPIEKNWLSTVKLIFRSNAITWSKFGGITPLGRAVRKRNLRIVEILLKAGANPNVHHREGKGEYSHPIILAIEYAGSEMIKLLIQYGANWEEDVLRQSTHPIVHAVQRAGYPSVIAILDSWGELIGKRKAAWKLHDPYLVKAQDLERNRRRSSIDILRRISDVRQRYTNFRG